MEVAIQIYFAQEKKHWKEGLLNHTAFDQFPDIII